MSESRPAQCFPLACLVLGDLPSTRINHRVSTNRRELRIPFSARMFLIFGCARMLHTSFLELNQRVSIDHCAIAPLPGVLRSSCFRRETGAFVCRGEAGACARQEEGCGRAASNSPVGMGKHVGPSAPVLVRDEASVNFAPARKRVLAILRWSWQSKNKKKKRLFH